MKIEVLGIDKLMLKLNALGAKSDAAVKANMKKITLDLQGKAQELAPVDESDLRGSAYSEVEGLDGYVGFTSEYALRQHEELTWHHPKDGQAKYLEEPYKENLPKYIKDIGKTVEKAVTK